MSRITRHFNQNIVARLQGIRGFSELAEKTGLSESTIRKLATGKNSNPTIKVVDALDKVLCVDSDFMSQGRAQAPMPEMSVSNEPEKLAL